MQCYPTDAVRLAPTVRVLDRAGLQISTGATSAAGPRSSCSPNFPAGPSCEVPGVAMSNVTVDWPASAAEMKNDLNDWGGFVCADPEGGPCCISRFDLRNSPGKKHLFFSVFKSFTNKDALSRQAWDRRQENSNARGVSFHHTAPYFNSNTRPGIGNWSSAPNRSWAHPETGIVHVYQPAGWGSWQFRLGTRTNSSYGDGASDLTFLCRNLTL
jgi:hypothetical protein